MLLHIHLKNYLTMDNISINLKSGLTCLTGETGAGKSILIDAIAYTLGAKCDKQVIQANKQQCILSLTFETNCKNNINSFLKMNNFPESEGICIIRRTIPTEGRSRYFLNDIPCSQNTIKLLAPNLIQISGQFQQQSILQKKHHIWLDAHLKNKTLLHDVKELYRKWRISEKDLSEQLQLIQQQKQQQSLLNYQLQELEEFAPCDTEYQDLYQRQKTIQNIAQTSQQLTECQQLLGGETQSSCLESLSKAVNILEKLNLNHYQQETRTSLTQSIHSMQQAQIELENASLEIQKIQQKITHKDYSDINLVERRLDQYYSFARKHQIQPTEIFAKLSALRQQLKLQQTNTNILQELTKDRDNNKKIFMQNATKLSAERKKSAVKLQKQLNDYMQQLAMPFSSCNISVNHDENNPSETGVDQVQIQIKTNPAQPFLPLNKVASGGELSRIVLALTVIYTKSHSTPTLIFDEIDTGIGGNTAMVVAKLIQELSEHTQVLCITHLAQVAAHATEQMKIEKNLNKHNIISNTLCTLDEQGRIKEIARMIGGDKSLNTAQQHAEKLLQAGNKNNHKQVK